MKKPSKRKSKDTLRRPSARTIKPSKPKSALQLVRDLFATAYKNGEIMKVWHIVSAMRGPDQYSMEKKAKFTTPLRKVVLTHEMAEAISVTDSHEYRVHNLADPVSVAELAAHKHNNHHFESHAGRAATAMQEE